MSDKKRKVADESATKSKKQRNSLEELNQKDSNGISQCFHQVSTLLYVSLAPKHVNNPVEGIRSQHLDPLLMTYFSSAGGVVLAHYNLQLHGQEPNSTIKAAKIMYDSPFAFLWISVDFLVWKPVSGDYLEGWINMQSPSHIGLLIHDTFNATIKRDSIPSDWSFVANEQPQQDEQDMDNGQISKSLGYWQDSNGNRIDGKLQFTVKSFNVSGRTVSVQGSLLKPGEVKDLTQYHAKDNYVAPVQTNKHITFSPQPEQEAESLVKYDDNNSDSSDSDSD